MVKIDTEKLDYSKMSKDKNIMIGHKYCVTKSYKFYLNGEEVDKETFEKDFRKTPSVHKFEKIMEMLE